MSKTVSELAAEPAVMTGITIAGTATAFSLRLRLHYKAAHAAGVMRRNGGLNA